MQKKGRVPARWASKTSDGIQQKTWFALTLLAEGQAHIPSTRDARESGRLTKCFFTQRARRDFP